MMRFVTGCVAVCAVLLGLISCEHRILTDPKDNHYIRVYLDEQIKNVTCGFYNPDYERPDYDSPVNLRAVLADPESGETVSERILRGNGQDERGRYIDGYLAAPAGTYNLLIHGVGSAVTRISNLQNYYGMYAYTDPVGEDSYRFLPVAGKASEEKRNENQPEHLFREVCEQINIRHSTRTDTLRNAQGDHFTAASMVLSYFMQVRIKGIEWVNSAAVLMSGMAGSAPMHLKEVAGSEPVDLFFTTKCTDREKSRDSDVSTAVIYATFNTFGKLPDRNTTMTIEFIKTDGSSQNEEFNIDGMFETPLVRDNRWILLEREITISRPEGTGGLRPGVDEWKDMDADVVM